MRLRNFGSRVRIIANLGILAAIVMVIIHTTSTWRRFDWQIFYNNARDVSAWHSIGAVGFIYAGFLLRAIRWSVLMRPVKTVPATRLFVPTVIGFTGLAMMGYPGELIRPYLIARRENLTISSQIAALTLERIFDMGSVGVLILAAILGSSQLKALSIPVQFRQGALLLIVFLLVLSLLALFLANNGEKFGLMLHQFLSPLSNRFSHKLAGLTKAFGADLNIIRDARSLAQLVILSVAIWFLIAMAYLETLHAFGALVAMTLVQAVLLLGFALVGSLAQLPAGSTQQVIMIAALITVFRVPAELAASCGILLWLTIIMAPVPLGLALVWLERLSFRSRLGAGGRTNVNL